MDELVAGPVQAADADAALCGGGGGGGGDVPSIHLPSSFSKRRLTDRPTDRTGVSGGGGRRWKEIWT